jgi:hypothetical protein
MNVRSTLLAALVCAALGSTAFALPYTVSGGSVSAHNTDPGLVINTSIAGGLGGHSFNLNDGQSSTPFAFFNIWTTESTVNNGEDTVPKPISATLNFSVPTGAGATVLGTTVGGYFGFLNNGQQGYLNWNGSVIVNAVDRTFEVTLSDETFNTGHLWLGLGHKGATVKATVKQINSIGTAAPGVPDAGSTTILLGISLLGLAALSRRMKSASR